MLVYLTLLRQTPTIRRRRGFGGAQAQGEDAATREDPRHRARDVRQRRLGSGHHAQDRRPHRVLRHRHLPVLSRQGRAPARDLRARLHRAGPAVAEGRARARSGGAAPQAGPRLHRVRPEASQQLPADVHDAQGARAEVDGRPGRSRARRLRAGPLGGAGVHRARTPREEVLGRGVGCADALGGGPRPLRSADHDGLRQVGPLAIHQGPLAPPARHPAQRNPAPLRRAMVDLALKTLLHDRTRFAITVAGVAFAVLLVLFQVGLFLGLLDNASVTIEHIDAELWVTSKNTPNVDFSHAFPESRVERVRSIAGVERADNLIITFLNIDLPSGAQEGIIAYALEDFSRWGIPWGKWEGELSDLRRGDYMFLDESATKRFGPFEVGEYREVNHERLRIIGRTRDAKSFTTTPMAFMDLRLAQRLNAQTLRGNTTYILVKLAPGADAKVVADEIRRRLPYNDVHTRAAWASKSRSYWVTNTGLGFNLFITVFLGCLVGIVVVAQTLYTSTMEHLKEFGTVKAIGGSNRDIYGILAKQASVAALVGLVLGVAVFVGTVALCLGAAMISFRKVAAIDPALVFRT